MRWGRVLTGVLVIGCATFAFAFYVPLMRAHEALTKQFLSLQAQVDAANRSVQAAKTEAKDLLEQKQSLQDQIALAKVAEKSGADASAAVKTALESKLQKVVAKEQAAVGTASGQAVAALSLNYLLTRGKLEVSADGKAALCSVATASNKRAIRVLAVADKKSIPATLAAKLKTPLDYGAAVSALVAQTLLDKCSVEAGQLSATSFPAEPAAGAKIEGKKLSGARVELWLDTAK
jgi:chromosome segregation ATPase